MGIRFNAGAIPVAVKYTPTPKRGFWESLKFFATVHLKWTGRLLRCAKPEDLPVSVIQFKAFG
jgi:hypothetical protein